MQFLLRQDVYCLPNPPHVATAALAVRSTSSSGEGDEYPAATGEETAESKQSMVCWDGLPAITNIIL
ncbi:hypothetical protein AMEX_G5649 [Astyanax mexicanus]|uniref:Uncharacterized protein n=1 Tax=Astyanax mexicanus TaxID=7994 RepID=A0A8T2M8Y9_ASTMX|nr:hypothetical protein AMEX_G5649 [Astyanax mexicanus]